MIEVRVSGRTWGVLSGGGLLQQERPWIADAMHSTPVGFGTQYRGSLSRDDAQALLDTMQDYASLLAGGGMDEDAPADGRSCQRDADRLKAALAVTP